MQEDPVAPVWVPGQLLLMTPPRFSPHVEIWTLFYERFVLAVFQPLGICDSHMFGVCLARGIKENRIFLETTSWKRFRVSALLGLKVDKRSCVSLRSGDISRFSS